MNNFGLIKVKLVTQGTELVAMDESSNVYKIRGLVIRKKETKSVLYETNESFFKAACPSLTVHKAEILKDNTVLLY